MQPHEKIQVLSNKTATMLIAEAEVECIRHFDGAKPPLVAAHAIVSALTAQTMHLSMLLDHLGAGPTSVPEEDDE